MKITHPNRILYPDYSITKMDVINYYQAVAPLMLPFVKERPLSVVRCPKDATKDCFFQKHLDSSSLNGVRSLPVRYKEKSDTALTVNTKAEILNLIQGGTIEIHGWMAQFKQIKNPDVIIFDLDPESLDLWHLVVDTAHRLKEMLEKLSLKPFLKVTGGKGVHIHVPIVPNYTWDEVKGFAKSLMRVLEEGTPKYYTTNMLKARRKNKIFLDYLRNGYGATAIIPYSLRARQEPTLAIPITWKQLTYSLTPNEYKISDLKEILRRTDPWKNYFGSAAKILVADAA